jgi:hypothetical protein
MAIITNNVVEFGSAEELNQYLSYNSHEFAHTNYLISKVNGSWYVTMPHGFIVNNEVQSRETFDASHGIDLSHTWSPVTNTTNFGDYVNMRSNGSLNWQEEPITNSTISRIKTITMKKYDTNETIDINSDDFKNQWQNYHTSYSIIGIQVL